ncbi:trichohyalin-like [Palaemon carinicauda]|uniref:trichohyalin-like n=1 Tax=Palaemon carinicauda TaxID=392227 RepID=UPI0035B58E74
MTADEINNLIDCHSNPLTEEDLQEMTKSASEEEDESASDEGDEAEEGGLTLHNLQDLFNVAKDLQKRAKEMDDNRIAANIKSRDDIFGQSGQCPAPSVAALVDQEPNEPTMREMSAIQALGVRVESLASDKKQIMSEINLLKGGRTSDQLSVKSSTNVFSVVEDWGSSPESGERLDSDEEGEFAVEKAARLSPQGEPKWSTLLDMKQQLSSMMQSYRPAIGSAAGHHSSVIDPLSHRRPVVSEIDVISHRRSPSFTAQRRVEVDLSRQSPVSQHLAKAHTADHQSKRDDARQIVKRTAKRQDGSRRKAERQRQQQAEPKRQRDEAQQLINEAAERQQQAGAKCQRDDSRQSSHGMAERQREHRVSAAHQDAAECQCQLDSPHSKTNHDSKCKASGCQLDVNMEQRKRAHVATHAPAQEGQGYDQNTAPITDLLEEDPDEILSQEEQLDDILEGEEEKPPQHSVDLKKLMLVFTELIPDNFTPVAPRSPPSEFIFGKAAKTSFYTKMVLSSSSKRALKLMGAWLDSKKALGKTCFVFPPAKLASKSSVCYETGEVLGLGVPASAQGDFSNLVDSSCPLAMRKT